MLLDDLSGLFALRPRQGFRRLRLTMNEAVLRGFLLGLTPLGRFARGAQIDDGTHDETGDVHVFTTQYVTIIPPVRGNTRLFERLAGRRPMAATQRRQQGPLPAKP